MTLTLCVVYIFDCRDVTPFYPGADYSVGMDTEYSALSQTSLPYSFSGVILPDLMSMEAGHTWALFLDIDGTLADIAATPDEAIIPQDILSALVAFDSGAVALVSGREIASIDKMTTPYRFVAAGQHGTEIRKSNGDYSVAQASENVPFEEISKEADTLARLYPGVIVERKSAGLALHYRKAPSYEVHVLVFLRRWIARYSDTLCLQQGKMVGEIRLKNVNKGTAIASLMESEPFIGKTPVFLGDDITDESGFAVVNAMSGVTVKIGNGDTQARYHMADPTQARQWLKEMIENLNSHKKSI